MIFCSLVMIGVLLKTPRSGSQPRPLRARPRLTLRLYDTNCPIKLQLVQMMTIETYGSTFSTNRMESLPAVSVRTIQIRRPINLFFVNAQGERVCQYAHAVG